jgi:hypothetical protein
MKTSTRRARIYDGDADRLIEAINQGEHVTLLPDSGSLKASDTTPRMRIMWGQHLLDDLLAGRYRSLICAVNAVDNSHGIITQLAELLPTSQWNAASITSHAKHFVQPNTVGVLKYDMDTVEVLALLRPLDRDHMTLADLAQGFRMVSQMIARRPERTPSASVSFLGARANALRDEHGEEPSFETVLRTMYDAGYHGDVYPAPWMWESGKTAVFARYPFPASVESMRHGGF